MSPIFSESRGPDKKRSIPIVQKMISKLFKPKAEKIDKKDPFDDEANSLNQRMRLQLHSIKNKALERYMARQPRADEISQLLQDYHSINILSKDISDFDTQTILDEYFSLGKIINKEVFQDLNSISLIEDLSRQDKHIESIARRHMSEFYSKSHNFEDHVVMVYQRQSILMLSEVSFLRQHLTTDPKTLASILFESNKCLPYLSTTDLINIMESSAKIQDSFMK